MKVLGISGSPRPNGNTATLLNSVLEGAAAQGAHTTMITANKLSVRSCQACDACKRTGCCVIKDDMQDIYAKINEADVVVFASPNYMGGISANLKPVLDRLYSYITASDTGELSTTLKAPKQVVLLITQNAPEEYTQFAGAFTPLRGILHLVFQGNFNALVPLLLAPGMKGPDSVAANRQLRETAFRTGAGLVGEAR